MRHRLLATTLALATLIILTLVAAGLAGAIYSVERIKTERVEALMRVQQEVAFARTQQRIGIGEAKQRRVDADLLRG
ncbi:hypothetical protein IH922_10270 [candidate division KSB1 bacterium]|nr:hypothetical protein [candidate division KSB1 bacterium]